MAVFRVEKTKDFTVMSNHHLHNTELSLFEERKVPLLYLFVEKYSKSEIKALRSFANGLSRDIDAVENAVEYDYSNGFVEGTNSRLKMMDCCVCGAYPCQRGTGVQGDQQS